MYMRLDRVLSSVRTLLRTIVSVARPEHICNACMRNADMPVIRCQGSRHVRAQAMHGSVSPGHVHGVRLHRHPTHLQRASAHPPCPRVRMPMCSYMHVVLLLAGAVVNLSHQAPSPAGANMAAPAPRLHAHATADVIDEHLVLAQLSHARVHLAPNHGAGGNADVLPEPYTPRGWYFLLSASDSHVTCSAPHALFQLVMIPALTPSACRNC